MELTPRTSPAAPTRPGSPRRRPFATAVVGLVVVALGVVAWQGLTNAAVYFRNADEAVAERDSLGDRRFRLQGTVVDGSITGTRAGADFEVVYNDVVVEVRHLGSTPELFQPGIPVVLEGRWADLADGDHFSSDRILVRHSEEYEADNDERLDEARDGGTGGDVDDIDDIGNAGDTDGADEGSQGDRAGEPDEGAARVVPAQP